MLTEEFNKLYEKSVKEGYDDYSLIDYSVQKPNEKNYPNWKSYWKDNIDYLIAKYKYTYGSKAKKKA
jgi:hypothetical protein